MSLADMAYYDKLERDAKRGYTDEEALADYPRVKAICEWQAANYINPVTSDPAVIAKRVQLAREAVRDE